MQWTIDKKEIVLEAIPFKVENLHLTDKRHGRPVTHPYTRLLCPDWVNIVPVTSEGEVIMIRQSRAGCFDDILETPGGVVDPGEEDKTVTARRELEEETGYVSDDIVHLTSVNPNPATHNNMLHCYLMRNCQRAVMRKHFPDENEDIEVVLIPFAELDQMVRDGKINSALACLSIQLAAKYIS